MKPFRNQTQRFKSKKFRSVRQELNPSPNIIFEHPFTGKKVNLRIFDISGAGFSVEERFDNSLLLPGMLIPKLNIEFMNGLELNCKCQVIYRTSHDYETVKCGFAFLDINLKNQIRLSSFLHQAMNKNCHVCTKINLDELWDFFFESGFVYPKKYFFIHSNRKRFEEVYKKLHEYDSDIAINFIYQDRGVIYGHMSMFRFYEKTWIINHYAANSAKRSRAGLAVLEQIGRYINEFHRLPSTKMDYVACYFRPDNKFPNLIFGGAARRSSDGCTIDEFSYLHLSK
ncbi:MAG: PilZ domain-containing protein, partial [Candidatus Heimdallarchaeota archaeon]|nr:PilZ domain-containing protein [Candidatus Heimdallarchaeota archaeon]